MSFGQELSHIVEQQIDKALRQKSGLSESVGGGIGAGGSDGGKIALLEANIQRLAEQVATYMSKQKETKRNVVDYGLEVLALHGMRIAITGGKAIFVDQDEPLHTSYMYFELSRGGAEREIRYIYLSNEGKIIESTTDPSNIGETYLPLAMVDVWSSSAEIIQERIQDIRPRSGKDIVESRDQSNGYLNGNVSMQSPDTGNDSFLIQATNPAGLKAKVSAGRALVGGEIVDAEGGILDLTNHRKVEKEFLGISDGETIEYELFHQSVSAVTAFVNDEWVEVQTDEAIGKITFSEPVEAGLPIRVSYQFTGNYPLVFLVEKVKTGTGKTYGVIGWKVGSNRNPQGEPILEEYQHGIGKVDLSSAIEAITDLMIDNSYEVINLTQEELQYGENLGSGSLKDGAIIANKIAANAVTANHIAVGSIDAAKIKSGSIQANHIAAGAIQAGHIGVGTITADKIEAGTISAEKFEDATWGDMTQAIRYVKSVLKNATSWRRKLSIDELGAGVLENVNCTSEEFPTLRLDTVRKWDQFEDDFILLPMSGKFLEDVKEKVQFYTDFMAEKTIEVRIGAPIKEINKVVNMFAEEARSHIAERLLPLYEYYMGLKDGNPDFDFDDWIDSGNIVKGFKKIIVEEFLNDLSKNVQYTFGSRENLRNTLGWTFGGEEIKISLLNSEERQNMLYQVLRKNSGNYNEAHFDNLLSEIFEELKTAFSQNNFVDWDKEKTFEEREQNEKDLFICLAEQFLLLLPEWIEYDGDTEIPFKLPAKVSSMLEGSEPEEIKEARKNTLWDYGNWDRPVFVSGSWESASIDYGRSEDLQSEFWVKPLNRAQAHQIKVQFRYSEDNLAWTEYEEGTRDITFGYLCWAGNLQRYRYLKVKVELNTTDPMEYELLAYPEVRIATCSTGTVGDIRFPAMTVKDGELKLNGAELDRVDYPALWKWAQEHNLIVAEATWNGGYQGYFSSGDTMNTFRLPDTRGEFFRVLDEGRGIDKDRVVGTSQGDAIRNIVGNTWKYDRAWNFSDDLMSLTEHRANIATGSGGSDNWCGLYQFNVGRVVPTASENRPHNIAYFACIRYE